MSTSFIPERGDLVWIDFDPHVGHEQAGVRPALVLSSAYYNGRSGFAFFCPITSKVKGYPYEVSLPPGLAVSGVVLADQVKSLDWRSRHPRRIGRVPAVVVADALGKAMTLLT